VTEDDRTRLASSAPRDDKTRLAPVRTDAQAGISARPISELPAASTPLPQTNAEYTEYQVTGNDSSGFAKARAIAQSTLAANGTLLKKRFVLEEVLGSGGMGTVYKTRDLRKVEAEDPNPYIATKVLNQDFKQHPDAFVTLQQEAVKSHTLAHPNIVTVHDFDRDGDVLFMTMELLEGEPLDKLIKAHSGTGMAKERALKLIQDMAAALGYAHQRNLIHSDFKPGNVFVSADGRAKVLDFGIARAASVEAQKHSFDAGSLGALTPAYATVEMLRGEPPSFADDVYALACVAYEMLAGSHPYERRSALQALEKGLKPKRIEALGARQWRALSRALSLVKAQRTPSIAAFIDEFIPSRTAAFVKIAAVIVAASLLGVGWFGYQQYQAKAKIKSTIEEKLSDAQTCFAESRFACAVEQAMVVVSLDGGNTGAATLLKNAQLGLQKQQTATRISHLISEAQNCLIEKNYACTQVKASEILDQDPKHIEAQALLAKADALIKSTEIAGLISQAEACLAKNDLGCAEVLNEQVSTINKQHPDAVALFTKVIAAKNQSMQIEQASTQKTMSFVNAGRNCLAQNNFTCAITQANAALAIDRGNTSAIELKQQAQSAQKQTLAAQNTVNDLLDQAQSCLDNKNYACAIAKSEAALSVIPGNSQASSIRSRAAETQRKIKAGFSIQ
jgi:serine/threonine protein kinase